MEDYLSVSCQPYGKYLSRITEVVIKDGVSSIGRNAFYGFTAIRSVTLPESLMAIEEYAFFGCSGITEVTIPEKVFAIGGYAFRKTNLKSAIFENADGWYAGTTEVTATDMSDTATAAEYIKLTYYKSEWYRAPVGEGNILASGEYKNLAWSLTDTGILTVTGSGDMPRFGSSSAPWYAYHGSIVNVVIEEGITSLGRCAFYSCTTLRNITLPDSLTTISEYALYGCTNLKELTIPKNVTRIETFVARRVNPKVKVTFAKLYGWTAGETAIEAYELNESAAAYLTMGYYKQIWTRDINVEEGELDTSIIASGLCGFNIRWNLDIYGTLTLRGSGAMPSYNTGETPWNAYMSEIKSVVILEGITTLSRVAFYDATALESVTLPTTLTEIGDSAFANCTSLTEIKIPEAVTKIGTYAFRKCPLTAVTFEDANGWSVDSGEVLAPIAANPTIAAILLSDTFYTSEWTKAE